MLSRREVPECDSCLGTSDDVEENASGSAGRENKAPIRRFCLRPLAIRILRTTLPSKATMALTAAFFQQILCWGMLMTFGAVFTYYANHLLAHVSTPKLALIGSIPPFLALFCSVFWGRLLDSGHHLVINAIGGGLSTAGLVALAFTGGDGTYASGSYAGVLLATFPIGLGQSCYFVTFSHVAKTWFPHCKGLAIGVAASGAAVGGSILPLMFKFWTSHSGFQTGISVLAALNGSLSLFITSFANAGPAFQPRKLGKCFELETWIPRAAFRSQSYRAHVAAMCCVYFSILSVPFFLEKWAEVNKIGIMEDGKNGAGVLKLTGNDDIYLVSTFNAFQFMGRLCGSLLTDSIRARKLHVISCFFSTFFILLFWFIPSNYAMAMLFCGLLGQATGIQVSLPVNDIQDILGPNRGERFGQYSGMTYLFASPFILTGPMITGLLVDRFGINAVAYWATGGFCLSAFFLIISLQADDVDRIDDVCGGKAA